MSLLDWTRSETISKPSTIEVGWESLVDGQPRTQLLQSTDISTSVSQYVPITYVDANGATQSTDALVFKEEKRKTTRARVNLEYVSERLKYSRGLPPGDDFERSVSTYEYIITTEGPKPVREKTTVYVSGIALAGQLQNVLYAWSDPVNPSVYQFYDPPADEFLNHETIVEYEETKGADGRDYTRTKTSRWISAASLPEMKKSFAVYMKALEDSGTATAAAVGDAVLAHFGLFFEGTEVNVNIGRAPVPSKPSDEELARNEVVNGVNFSSDDTPSEVFGNDEGWTGYVPEDPVEIARSCSSEGYRRFFVRGQITLTSNEQIEQYLMILATELTDPSQLQDFPFNLFDEWQEATLAIPSNPQAFESWFYGPGPPVTLAKDIKSADCQSPGSSNWQDYNEDSDGDGVPDWAPFVPDSLEDYNVDSNGDGIPDWADYVPGDWDDYVDNPADWENTAIDSDNDGIPDWADYVPIGWEEFDTDTTYVNPEPETNNDKSITGRVVFDGQSYNDDNPTATTTYAMPYAPDDYFYYDKSIRKLYRSGAKKAAIKFGQTESALDIGHAYGQNIVTNFDLTPTLDLSPVYIRLAGIEGAFLLDAPSYAWGPEGMVVSSDLMLIGVTGYDGVSAPATSWLRLPVTPSAIGPAGSTTVEASPLKANSINIPNGFDVRNLAAVFAALPTNGTDVFREWRNQTSLVPPSLVLEREVIAAGPALRAVEFEYALDAGIDEAVLASGPAVEFNWTTVVQLPLSTLSLTAPTPVAAPDLVVVQLPLSTLTIGPVAPVVTADTVVVQLPVTTLTLTAAGVVGGITQVDLPLSTLTITDPVPVVMEVTSQNYFGSWAAQNRPWPVDYPPTWWAN